MISIIIPTLNEEEYLPKLLESIRQQKFKDIEVIVADAGSKDRTVAIAKARGCKVTPGGLPGKGRNEGAKAAKGDLFVFLDADITLPADFFAKALGEFSKRDLAVASVTLDPKKFFSRLLYWILWNLPIVLLEWLLPHGAMCIIVKRNVFSKVGGFDESITLAEDAYFTRQASQCGKFGILRSTKVFVDTRRFQKDGWVRTYCKLVLCELHMIFVGPVRSDIFKYHFGYPAKKQKEGKTT